MSKSGDGRFLGHSKSWPSDRDSDIDRALSVGFDKSRGSLLRIWPPLKDEFNDLRKLYEDLQKKYEGVQKEKKDLQKENEGLQKENKDLKSAEGNFKLKALLREILRKFKESHLSVNVGLMKRAHNMYRSDFPWDFSGKNPTFTGTIAALVKEQANESTKYKLALLLDVARDFCPSSLHWWNAEIGTQFFFLCKSVAQWNNVDFHPAIGKEQREDEALIGTCTVDGVDYKKLVMQLLDTFT